MKKVHGQNLRVKYYPEGGDKISLLNIVLNSISLWKVSTDYILYEILSDTQYFMGDFFYVTNSP